MADDTTSGTLEVARPSVEELAIPLPKPTDTARESDTREALRTHFEVSPEHIAYASLHGLCLTGEADRDELRRMVGELGIDTERINPQFA